MDEYLNFGRIEDTREILKSTREKLVERNTHVRITDKYGWDTLEEYVGDNLVDGPDEATKLRKQTFEPSRRGKKSPIKSRMTGAVHPSGMIFFVSTIEKLADNISRKQGIFPAPGQQRHRSTYLDSPSPSLQSVSTALKKDTWHHNVHSKSKEGHIC